MLSGVVLVLLVTTAAITLAASRSTKQFHVERSTHSPDWFAQQKEKPLHASDQNRNDGSYGRDPTFIALSAKAQEYGLDADTISQSQPSDLVDGLERLRVEFPEDSVQAPVEDFIASFKPSTSTVLARSLDWKGVPGYIKEYTERALAKISEGSAEAAKRVQDLVDGLSNVVSVAGELTAKIQDQGLDQKRVSELFANELANLRETLEAEFPNPTEAPQHDERKELIGRVLEWAEDAMVRVCESLGMPGEDIRPTFHKLLPPIQNVLTTTGDLVEQHPQFLEIVLWTGVIMIIPEGFILRPILSMFGFGPDGPAKRSAASWAQRRFWGAAVARGSWFARLQSAGMSSWTSWGWWCWGWWWQSLWLAILSVKIFG